MIRSIRFPLALALVAPALAYAQASTETLEEVNVFGKNFVATVNTSGSKSDTPPIETPQSLSVISSDLLDSWNTSNLSETLRYTPGVNSEPFGMDPRFTSVTMRGFTSAAAGIYRDGLALINPGWTVSYNLEPYGAERIEIPRGPASVLYGQSSPGGLINFVSKMPKEVAFGEVGVEFGNYDTKQAQLDVGTPVSDTVAVRLTGLARDSGTQVDFIPDRRIFLEGSTRWKFSDRGTFTLLGTYQHDTTKDSQSLPAQGTLDFNPNGHLPLSRFTGDPGIDHYERKEYSAGYQLNYEFNDAVRFFQNVRYNHATLTEVALYALGLKADLRTLSRGTAWSYGDLGAFTMDNQLHITQTMGDVRQKILLGVDYQNVVADHTQYSTRATPGIDLYDPIYPVVDPRPASPWGDDHITLSQLGVYLQDEVKIQEKLIFNGAVRFDRAPTHDFSRLSNSVTQDQKDTDVTYRLGAVYLLDSGFAPYLSYATSFLPSSGVDVDGNPFKPEKGKQYEAGVKYQPKSFNALFTLAAFDLQRRNFVDQDDNFILFQTGKAESKGIEFEAFTAMDNGLSYTASYSYLDTEQKENKTPELVGKKFAQIPTHKGAVWADYNFRAFGLNDLGVGVGARYQSPTFSDDANTFQSPGYTLFDAAVHYQFKNLRFGLNVQNLTNKEYMSSCFTRASVLCTFGQLRTVRGTIKYRW